MENITVYAKSASIQASAKLVIKDFVYVMSSSQPGKYYESKSFMVGDTPMAIRVYPNGFSNPQTTGVVSIILWNNSDSNITVNYQFITDVRSGQKKEGRVIKAKNGFGHFLRHAECTDAYKDKDFLVTVNVEVPREDSKLLEEESGDAPKKHCDFVCNNLYEQMKDTNFTLVFNGVEVACHKHVLAAASSVFEAMVENQHLEAIKSKANINLSEEVGSAFVQFIYTGELEEGVLKEQPDAFLELGDKYDMQALKDLAEGELLRQLSKKNMVELMSIGEIFGADKIFEAALKMTKGNMAWLRFQV